jgi:hypothetical protein
MEDKLRLKLLVKVRFGGEVRFGSGEGRIGRHSSAAAAFGGAPRQQWLGFPSTMDGE